LYYSPSSISVFKSITGRLNMYVALMEEEGKVYRVLVRKAKGRRPLGRHRHR